MKEFDENDAVAYIQEHVDAARQYDEDDLLLVIDTMFEFYESLDDDAPDEKFATDVVASHVERQIARDKECHIAPEHVLPIVEAELDYEETLDDDEF